MLGKLGKEHRIFTIYIILVQYTTFLFKWPCFEDFSIFLTKKKKMLSKYASSPLKWINNIKKTCTCTHKNARHIVTFMQRICFFLLFQYLTFVWRKLRASPVFVPLPSYAIWEIFCCKSVLSEYSPSPNCGFTVWLYKPVREYINRIYDGTVE